MIGLVGFGGYLDARGKEMSWMTYMYLAYFPKKSSHYS